jgi:hypothetical protein
MPSDSPELHPLHKPHGRHWTELILSVAALITSAMSVYIALRHGEVMDKMLRANSLPFLTVYSGDFVDGKTIAHFSLRNEGVGPARVMSLRLALNGKPLHNFNDFLTECCQGHAADGTIEVSSAYERFIPARGESELFSLEPSNRNDPLFVKFDQGRAHLHIDLCYCSVFDECYQWKEFVAEATRVDKCAFDPNTDFMP